MDTNINNNCERIYRTNPNKKNLHKLSKVVENINKSSLFNLSTNTTMNRSDKPIDVKAANALILLSMSNQKKTEYQQRKKSLFFH